MQDVTDPVSFLVIVHRIFLIQMIFSILQDHILACFILHANRKRRYFGEAGKWIVLGPHECHYSFFSVHLSIVSLSLTAVFPRSLMQTLNAAPLTKAMFHLNQTRK